MPLDLQDHAGPRIDLEDEDVVLGRQKGDGLNPSVQAGGQVGELGIKHAP